MAGSPGAWAVWGVLLQVEGCTTPGGAMHTVYTGALPPGGPPARPCQGRDPETPDLPRLRGCRFSLRPGAGAPFPPSLSPWRFGDTFLRGTEVPGSVRALLGPLPLLRAARPPAAPLLTFGVCA